MNTTVTTAAVKDARAPEAVHLQSIIAVCFGSLAEPLEPVDQEREWLIQAEGLLIQAEGLLMQVEMSIWARTCDMGAHGAATRHHTRMLELIKGRAEAVRARMAQERGLPHA